MPPSRCMPTGSAVLTVVVVAVLLTTASSFVLAGAPVARPGLSLRASSIATQGMPFAIAAVDLDRDGTVDLAVTHLDPASASILLGRGDGTFAAPRDLGSVGRNPRGLVVGDFNRDGAPDLAISATNDNAVNVLDGLGDGRFAKPRSFSVGIHPFLLTAADLNGDGATDLAVAIEASGVFVLLGDGRGGFKGQAYATGKWSSDVAAADFDGDGRIDLAVTNWGSNNVSLLFGIGDGTFAAPRNVTYEGNFWDHHALYRVLAADLDRDGHVEMVWNDIMTASLYVAYGDGTGAFPVHKLLKAGRGVRHAVAADLDGDGWLDLVSANLSSDTVSVMLADGQGGFRPSQHFKVGRAPRMVAVADFNHDQRPDIAVTNMDSNDITVLINEGIVDLAPDFDPEAVHAPPVPPVPTGLAQPAGIALDPAGSLLVADEGNHRVVRIDPHTGAIATVAGTGQEMYGGDGGPATAAKLSHPTGLAVDAAGDIFVADSGNHRVRRIDPSGMILTVAGTGENGYAGDGGPATNAKLFRPSALVVDAAKNLYIADSANCRIRKVDAAGTITTIVGTGIAGYSGDGGPGTAAEIRSVTGLALDRNNALLIADPTNLRVRKLDSNGTITTVAGNGSVGPAGDAGPATSAALGYPTAVSVDELGALYIAEPASQAIRMVAPDGIIRTLAAAAFADTVEGRKGQQALPWGAFGVVVDQQGSVFFTDRNNQSVRKVDPRGQVTVIAGAATEMAAPSTVNVAAETLSSVPREQAKAQIALDWEYKFRSGSDDNAAYAVAAGRDGSIYVAGDVGSGADWRVLQLTADGKPGWHFDFDGGNIDVPLSLVVTPDNQIVAAGTTYSGAANGRDVLVISLSPSGQENWRYTEARPGDQAAHAIVADAAGNLFVAGEAERKWQVWSLDAHGSLRWRYEDGREGSANAAAVDAGGNLLVAGSEPSAWRVIKINPDRELLWEHRIADPASANSVAVTADGGAVVAGTRTSGRVLLRAEKLDANGNVAWEYEARNDAGTVVGKAVLLDSAGNAIIVGDIATDWLILALDSSGRHLWHFTYDGGGQLKNRDQAFAVAAKPSAELVVAGRIHPVPPRPPLLGEVEWRVASYRVAEK